MLVRAIRNFYDRENDLILRQAGETFEVSEARAEELMAKGTAEPVKEPAGQNEEPVGQSEGLAAEADQDPADQKEPAHKPERKSRGKKTAK